MPAVARVRRPLGLARRRVRVALAGPPLRLRRPFFSPERECRRALALHERMLRGETVALSEWETHRAVLLELLRRIPEPRVLELGIGFGSTPLVLGLSAESVSLETDERWVRRFARFAGPRHTILLQTTFDEHAWDSPWLDASWDVALVDNAPARTRQQNLERVAGGARFVVCHDTEELYKPSAADYRWDFSGFPHVWTCTSFPTYTTVVSKVEPIDLDHLPGIAGQPPPLA